MSYTDNAPLITAWDNRVQALKDKIATLYDGTSHNVLIEQTEANVLLSSVDGLTLDSNEQAPQITLEAPALVVEPSEDQGTEEVTEEETEEESTEEDETVEDETEEVENE